MDGYVRGTLVAFVAFILGGVEAARPVAPVVLPPMPTPMPTATATAAPSPTTTPTSTPTTEPTPTPTPLPDWWVQVPWKVDCEDEDIYNGYMNQGYCVPGRVTYEGSHFRNPKGFAGAMSSYDPGVMQIVCENRGLDCGRYRGIAAVMGCGNIGDTAYLRRPGGEWYGPLLIVDCTAQHDAFVNIYVKQIAIEVDYDTAVEQFGARTIGWVQVRINNGGVPGGYEMSLSWWWRNYILAFEWLPTRQRPTPTS